MQSQVQQGEALKREYGVGGSNPLLGDGFAKDVLTSLQDKWKQAKAQNSKLREMFGENLDKAYAGKTRDEVLESSIDMKMKSEIGSAIGYENAKKTAQEKRLVDNPDDITLASSNIQTQAELLSASKKMKAEKDRAIADSQQENREKREAIAKSAIANEEGGIKGYKAQLNTEKALLQETENQLRKAQLSKAQSDGLFSRMFGVQQEKQDKIDSLMAERNSALSRIDKLNNAITSEANKIAQATPMETRNITDSDAVFNIADKVSSMDAYTFSLSSAQFAGT